MCLWSGSQSAEMAETPKRTTSIHFPGMMTSIDSERSVKSGKSAGSNSRGTTSDVNRLKSDGSHTSATSAKARQSVHNERKQTMLFKLRNAASKGGIEASFNAQQNEPAAASTQRMSQLLNPEEAERLFQLTDYDHEDSLVTRQAHAGGRFPSRWTPTRDGWDNVEYKGLLGLRHIFTLNGSIYLNVVPRILVSIIVVLLLKLLPLATDDSSDRPYFSEVLEHQFTYQIFTYVLGFVLVFRINLAYMRWWDARTAIEGMSSRWFDAALLACTFDEYSTVAEAERMAFRVQISGLVSMMHSEALKELGGRTIPFLHQYLTRSDYEDRFEGSTLKNGVTQAHLWITMLLTGRFNRHIVQSPICSRMYEALSEGLLCYHQAVCIRTTPFPFSFVQIIQIGMMVFALTMPLVMVKWVNGLGWCMFFTAFTCFGYSALAEAANELEQPFGEDENDHPILAYQVDFDRELRALAMGGVSYAPPRPCEEFLERLTSSLPKDAFMAPGHDVASPQSPPHKEPAQSAGSPSIIGAQGSSNRQLSASSRSAGSVGALEATPENESETPGGQVPSTE